MTPRFLRDEAARFRGMADDAEREATKSRLLAMAADYDARAKDADGLIEPPADETVAPVAAAPEAETITPKVGRKIAKAVKESIVIERRPASRLR